MKFCNITIESCALYLLTLIKTTTTTFPWEYTGGYTTRVAVVVIAKRDQSRRQPIMVNVLGKLNSKSKAESFPQTDLRLHCSLSPLRCIAWGFAVANCWFVCDQSPLHYYYFALFKIESVVYYISQSSEVNELLLLVIVYYLHATTNRCVVYEKCEPFYANSTLLYREPP